MTRDIVPFSVADMSALARSLSRQLDAGPEAPSHLTLLNMLARGAGFRNFQHLRAARSAERRLDAAPVPATAVDHTLVARALNCFDATGQLRHWPARRAVQVLCLWGLWSRLSPKGAPWTERQISAALGRLHLFGDPAILRREMVQLGLVMRNQDGTGYARIEQPPPPEARALIGWLRDRRSDPPA